MPIPIIILRAIAFGQAMLRSGICIARWRQIVQAFTATSVAAINLKVEQWWATPAAQSLFRQGQATVRVTITGSGRFWNWNYTSRYGDRMSTFASSSRQAAQQAATSSSNTLIRDALKKAQYVIEERAAWNLFTSICPASLLYLFNPPSSGKTAESGSEVTVKVKMTVDFKAKKSCTGCSSSSGPARAVGLRNIMAAAQPGRCSWVRDGVPKITYKLEPVSDSSICSSLMAQVVAFVKTLNASSVAAGLKVTPPPQAQANTLFGQFLSSLTSPTCSGSNAAIGTISDVQLGEVKVTWNQSFPYPA